MRWVILFLTLLIYGCTASNTRILDLGECYDELPFTLREVQPLLHQQCYNNFIKYDNLSCDLEYTDCGLLHAITLLNASYCHYDFPNCSVPHDGYYEKEHFCDYSIENCDYAIGFAAKNEKTCDQFDENGKQNCLFAYAIATRNPIICKSIGTELDEQKASLCFAALGTQTNAPKLCDKAGQYEIKCKQILNMKKAIKQKNKDLCWGEGGDWNQMASCNIMVANLTLNISDCGGLIINSGTFEAKDICTYNVAVALKNRTDCDFIESKPMQEKCALLLQTPEERLEREKQQRINQEREETNIELGKKIDKIILLKNLTACNELIDSNLIKKCKDGIYCGGGDELCHPFIREKNMIMAKNAAKKGFVTECEKLQPLSKEICYFELAIKLDNPKYCEKLGYEYMFWSGFGKIYYSMYNSCQTYFSIKRNQTDFCDSIKGPDKVICVTQTINKKVVQNVSILRDVEGMAPQHGWDGRTIDMNQQNYVIDPANNSLNFSCYEPGYILPGKICTRPAANLVLEN